MREPRARRLLAIMLALYPQAFRWRLGSDLLETAISRWRDAQRAGPAAELRYWLTDGVRFALDGLLENARVVAFAAAVEARHVWRRVWRAPGHYGLAVVTLALGVGATTAIFTVADGVVFRPLPYDHADELYLIHTRFGALEVSSNSLPNLRDVQDAVPFLTWLAGAADRSPALTDDGEAAERISVIDVTEQYLPGLGARVLAGRSFTVDDYGGDADRVMIVSHALWQRRWGSDPELIGRTIRLDGTAHTVVGVMHPAFRDPEPIESGTLTAAWTPTRGISGTYRHRDYYAFRMIARVVDSPTLDVLRQQLTAAGTALSAEHPEANRVNDDVMDFVLHPLHEATVGDARARLLLLLGAVVLLLLLSCANVANLFLARGMMRTSELSVRAALGATRARLGAQLFGESLLTAAVAGVVGVALAAGGLRVFLAAAPTGIPRLHEIGIDARAIGLILLLTITTAAFFGSVPALRGARVAHSGARSTSSRRAQRFQSSLLGVQIAISLVLLTGAALLLGSFRQLLRTEPGFERENVLVVDVRPPLDATSHEQALLFYRTLMERAGAVPGVNSAALLHTVPGIQGGAWTRITPDEITDQAARAPRPRAALLGIDPGNDFMRLNPVYGDAFRTLGITLIAGRAFDEEPGAGDPLVVVINEAAAQRLFPEIDRPVGRRLALGAPEAGTPLREIVGIVGNVRQQGAAREPDAQVYLPYGQRDINRMSLVLKVEGGAVIPGDVIRGLVNDVAPGLPVDRFEFLATRYAATADQSRFLALLLTTFAAVGLTLAVVGTYALAAQSMTRRVRELGVRIALGARANNVLTLVLTRVLLTAGAGIAAGIMLALALTRFIEIHIVGVSAHDPLTFALAAAIIAVSAVLASLGPAVRAARIDPNEVLRSE